MPPATLNTAAAKLPAEPNSFVGRERDLADLAVLLADVRMLTLCGPGGVGKTRLAARLAARLADRFPGGAWLIELADTQDAALIGQHVAAALGIREEPDRPVSDTLADALRQQQLLLVLDTCEHLIEAVAEFAQRLLAQCPSVRVVATSREPLRVRGETVWRVPPLSLPPAGLPPGQPLADLAAHEAVRLFLDRAAAVRPGFALSRENADAVTRLCRTLDGMPLAIELAAARMRALSAEQIAARLDHRFHLLASGDRTAPLRQQTLRAAVDWSHDLLTSSEQLLLRRLAVFSGWSLDMAEQVCADQQVPPGQILDLLADLIDKSLVTLDDERDGTARYRLLDTIREYAAERLADAAEEPAIRLRHLSYMLRLVEDITDKAFRRGDPPWPERVVLYLGSARELPNYRAALTTALEYGEVEQGLRLCSALRAPWVVIGDVSEGLGWFERFLRIGGDAAPAVRARALTLSAELAFEQQDYAKAATAAQAASELCRTAGIPGSAGALRLLALVSLRAGQTAEALDHVQTAVAAARADADPWEEGLALTAQATVLSRLGEASQASEAFETALAVLADNNRWGVAHALYGYGTLARASGDNAAALRHFRSALALFREIDARNEIARCLAGIGWVTLSAGDLIQAATSLSESLRLSLATGQRLGVARGLDAIAALAVAADDPATAVRLKGAAAALRNLVGPARSDKARPDGVLAAARRQTGEHAAAQLLAEGERMSVDEAVGCALACSVAALSREPAPDPPRPQDTARQQATLRQANGSGDRKPVLTTRERQIADLIARGLSNRAIAAELVISPATAARHVANIFGKLGVTSRAQVAAWTVEQTPGTRG
jgi:predicted ATPase/DNA-binding CsgD family transcriptional regulator/Tfp pilus assembly protein PilF